MRPRQYIPVAAACLAIQFCAGVLYMWSVFAGPIHGEYGWDQAAVSFTASLMLLVFVGGMALGGGIADRIGPRLVSCAGTILFCLGWFLSSLLGSESIPWMIYLSYSGMSGIGAGFVYSCALSCMQRWLPNRKGLASGLSLSAFGFSVVFFTPVAELLLSRFGVAATFRIFALIFFIVMMPASLFIKYPAEVSSG
ncbi:MAG: MFS transporter, partial [Synergistaceae bacterium]|nr:MFS transporter [Synergistaceae bacterium]